MLLIRALFLLFISQICFNSGSQPTTIHANDIKGKWSTTNNEAVVEVYEVNNLYYGRIISLSKPFDKKGKLKTDHRNKDPQLQKRLLLGINTLYDLRFNESERNWQGKVYIPLTGMEVDGILSVHNENTLHIRGTLGALRKTQIWLRVK